MWLPKDGHQKLIACSQPGSEITIDKSLGRWVVRNKFLRVTLRQHPQAVGQIPLLVQRLHPPRRTTSLPSTHPSILLTNPASLTIQSPLNLNHTLCQRLHPYMNLPVILNLIWCQKNMLRVSTARTAPFNLIALILRRLLVHFPIHKGIYLEFKPPWGIQTHSRRRRHQVLDILQDIGRGSSWSYIDVKGLFCLTCAFFEFLLLSYYHLHFVAFIYLCNILAWHIVITSCKPFNDFGLKNHAAFIVIYRGRTQLNWNLQSISAWKCITFDRHDGGDVRWGDHQPRWWHQSIRGWSTDVRLQ